MERVEGLVLNGGRVVAGPVAAWVEFETTPTGRPAWYGHFELPAGADLTSGGYEFRAMDGRAGRVRVLWCQACERPGLWAEFRGSGAFQ